MGPIDLASRCGNLGPVTQGDVIMVDAIDKMTNTDV